MRNTLYQVGLGGIVLITLIDVQSPTPKWADHLLSLGSWIIHISVERGWSHISMYVFIISLSLLFTEDVTRHFMLLPQIPNCTTRNHMTNLLSFFLSAYYVTAKAMKPEHRVSTCTDTWLCSIVHGLHAYIPLWNSKEEHLLFQVWK